MPTLDVLNEQFGLTGQLHFSHQAEDFPMIEINNAQSQATIALQGGHVMTYQPKGQEPLIWLSAAAKFQPGKSIRGGVPVCWPWFGAHAQDSSKPGHGHARTVMWEVLETAALESGATQVRMQLIVDATTQAFWAHNTPVQVLITVGEDLRVELITRNDSDAAVTISEALHTYFHISDISEVKIVGLEDTEYLDKVGTEQRKTQQGAITINGEVDRVYVNTDAECFIEDAGFKRRIRISKTHSQSTVVWNPWQAKAEKMGDLGEQGYRQMLCVESANALENSVEIAAGAQHSLAVVYRVEPF